MNCLHSTTSSSNPPRRNLCSVLILSGFQIFQILLALSCGIFCHFLSLVCLQYCYIRSWGSLYRASASQFVLSQTNHEKSFGSTHFWAIFMWALAKSAFMEPDKRHHTHYVARRGTQTYYYSFTSLHLMLLTAVYHFTGQRVHTVE